MQNKKKRRGAQKAELDNAVATFTGVPLDQVRFITQVFLEEVGRALVDKGGVLLPKLGYLRVSFPNPKPIQKGKNYAYLKYCSTETRDTFGGRRLRVFFRKSVILNTALREKLLNEKARSSSRKTKRTNGKSSK